MKPASVIDSPASIIDSVLKSLEQRSPVPLHILSFYLKRDYRLDISDRVLATALNRVLAAALKFLEATHHITKIGVDGFEYELTSTGRKEAQRLLRKSKRPALAQVTAA
jgi:hypothetical protein